jgi:hypothetical protein
MRGVGRLRRVGVERMEGMRKREEVHWVAF